MTPFYIYIVEIPSLVQNSDLMECYFDWASELGLGISNGNRWYHLQATLQETQTLIYCEVYAPTVSANTVFLPPLIWFQWILVTVTPQSASLIMPITIR